MHLNLQYSHKLKPFKFMAKLLCLLLSRLIILFFTFPTSTATYYNVLNFGAKPDGKTDSTEPFLRAWAAACRLITPTIIYVPTGSFVLSPTVFNGPCRCNAIKFSIRGTILAPPSYMGLGGARRWIVFDNVQGLTVEGGRFDGRGRSLWACKAAAGRNCPPGATSLTLRNSKNVVISGLTSINSELFHIVITGCRNVTAAEVNIAAPESSPNTDGIHLQASVGVTIRRATIGTGDDCISVGPGVMGLWIKQVFCGPGHGISIGSLGRKGGGEGGMERVEDVTVQDVIFSGSQNGARIKTWGRRSSEGFVRGVRFQNLVMRNVRNPIIIDQNYCPHDVACPNQKSGIKISQVRYKDIKGSSATKIAMKFDCSPSNPCNGISLQNINLTYQNQRAASSCKYAHGTASGLMVPPSCFL